METLIPDLRNHESTTLYIIGNGFDLHHGLPTSYYDFYQWLRDMKYDDFIAKMEELFPLESKGGKMLWFDFETALGEYDIDEIHTKYTPDYTKRNIKDVELFAKRAIEPTISVIKSRILEWAQSINLYEYEAKPILELPQNSLYLTFNYTLTLENLYHLHANQILHIHKSTEDKEVIVGNDIKKNRWQLEHIELPYEEEYSKKELIDLFNTLYKNQVDNIKKNRDFFSRLNRVNRVVVLGHSLSDIDIAYIREVCKCIQEGAYWYISKHCCADMRRIEKCIEMITLLSCKSTSRDKITVFPF